MRINSINSKQNFGMSIKKDGYLDCQKEDFFKLKSLLNQYSLPPYKNYINRMCDKFDKLDEVAKGVDVDVCRIEYADKGYDGGPFNMGYMFYPHKKRFGHILDTKFLFPFISEQVLDDMIKQTKIYIEDNLK